MQAIEDYCRQVEAPDAGRVRSEWVDKTSGLVGRAAGVLWASEVVLLQDPARHGFVVEGSKGESRFSGECG